MNSTVFDSLLIFCGACLFIGLVPSVRRVLVTRRLLALVKSILPSISETEAAALEAGSPWWDADLFQGNPDWEKLLREPWAELTTEEEAFLAGPVEQFCSMISDWDITHNLKDLPADAWAFLKSEGFFGLVIPKAYGGKGFSPYAVLRVVAKIATCSGTAAVVVMVPNSLGPGELLIRYGTQAQRDKFLRLLAKGEIVPCFGLTSPTAGSDAASLVDKGVVCRGDFGDQRNVLGVRLTWNKRYITLAPVADLLGLAFKIEDPQGLLGRPVNHEITLALVPTDTQGVEIGNRALPLNAPFMNGPTRGQDVFLPMSYIIGEEAGIGQGWRMLMECLAAGRGVSLPALSVGSGKLTSRSVGAYARIRQQFNLPVGKFEGVEEVLAEVAGLTYMMDAASAMNAAALGRGAQSSVLSGILKYHLTEMMRTAVNHGMDVLGGKGIIMGPQNFMGTPYMTIPIAITVEGANILTRSLIIFGQGSIRCHPYLYKEVRAAMAYDPKTPSSDTLVEFDRNFWGHVGYALGNFGRCLAGNTLGLPVFRVPEQVDPQLRKYYVQLSRMSSALAVLSEMSLVVLGGSIKRKEKLSARLGDVLSYLYMASSVLRRFEESGVESELVLVEWGCEYSLYRIGTAIEGFLRNFPNVFIAGILRRLIFPFGNGFTAPSDRLGAAVARTILNSGTIRDELTHGMFIPEDLDQPVAAIEKALPLVEAAAVIEKKVRGAVKSGLVKGLSSQEQLQQALAIGVLSEAEFGQYAEALYWCGRVIQVDEFSELHSGTYGALATPVIQALKGSSGYSTIDE